MTDNGSTAADAVRALRARGIDDPEQLLQYATPDQIIAACHRWDTRQNARTGLLVNWIRNGQFGEPTPASKDIARRTAFDHFTAKFPVGSIVETHNETIDLMWPDDPNRCAGRMIVQGLRYPHVKLRCDVCGFEAFIGISPPGSKTPPGVPPPAGRTPQTQMEV